MLDICIINNDGYFIRPGKALTSEHIIRENDICPDRKFFRLTEAQSDLSDIDGWDVLLAGKEYIIDNRHYPLEGYALKAKLTTEMQVIPYLRRAIGKETSVRKDEDGNPVLDRWPVIIRTWEEPRIEIEEENPESEELIEEILNLRVDDESFSEYNEIEEEEE